MGEPLVWASTADNPATGWFWGKRLDPIWIGGGGFFAFLLVAVPLSLHPKGPGWLTVAFLHLSILCNYPHYTATYHLVVRERKRRPEALIWLIFSIPVMLALLWAGATWQAIVWPLVMRAYLTWSAHHYAAQHYGIAVAYCHRFGRPLMPDEKKLLQFAFLGLGLFMMLMANSLLGSLTGNANGVVGIAGGLSIPRANFPAWIYWPGLLLVIACVGAFWQSHRRLKIRLGQGLPAMAFWLFATNFAWFVVPNILLPDGSSLVPPQIALCLVGATPFFHCAQYLFVTMDRTRKSGTVKPIWLYTGLVAYGFILFHAPLPFIPKLTSLTTLKGALLLTAVVNIHHFWIDGLIWRRPKPRTQAAS